MIAFLNSGMRMGHDQIMIRIHHRREEGYPLSADGHEIKEEMPLPEFLRRIFPDEKYVEIEMYRVSKAMDRGRHGGYGSSYTEELEKCAQVYNTMYIKLFRDKKTVLAQHTLSGISGVPPQYFGGIDPYQQRQAMAQDSDQYRRQAMMGQMSTPPIRTGTMMEDPSIKQMHREAIQKMDKEAEKKKRDDDLYYLTT